MSECDNCGMRTHTLTLDTGEEVEVCFICDDAIVETRDEDGGDDGT